MSVLLVPPVSAKPRSYLDIETAYDQTITIVGIWREDREMLQLVGGQVTAVAILQYLHGSGVLHTYNGHSFDLPVIKRCTGLDVRKEFPCRDIMYDCWKRQLKGGFKKVEQKLGIGRQTEGVDGMQAMMLWDRWIQEDDRTSLDRLLLYNKEDVMNLAAVRDRLDAMPIPGR